MEGDLQKKDLVSSVQAAERFGITNDYVSMLCRQGKVAGERMGKGVWFVRPQDLESYLSATRQKQTNRTEVLGQQLRQEYQSFAKKPAAPFWPPTPRALVVSLAGLLLVLTCMAGGLALPYAPSLAAAGQVESPFFSNSKAVVGEALSFFRSFFAPSFPAATSTTENKTTVVQNTYPVVERTIEHTIERLVGGGRVAGGIPRMEFEDRLLSLTQFVIDYNNTRRFVFAGGGTTLVTNVTNISGDSAESWEIIDSYLAPTTTLGFIVSASSTVVGDFSVTDTLRVASLVSCDTIDTDADGNFSCGTDDGGSGLSFTYPFPSNATSTLLTFSGGLLSTASSTIGSGTQAGGLTISGGATTTGFLSVAPNSTDSFALKSRTGAGVTVPYFVPTGSGANLPIAFDILVKGTPSNITNLGVSWIDLTDTNETRLLTDDYQALRLGKNLNGWGYISMAQGNGDIGNNASNTPLVLQHFSGNVGIGTTSPNNVLDISSTTKAAIGFTGASGSTYKWTIGMDVSNGGRFSIASSTQLGTLDRFVINGAGNVGIGTTTPQAPLNVIGSIRLDATSPGLATSLTGYTGSGTQYLTLGVAGAAGNLLTDSVTGDVVLSNLQSNALLFGTAGVERLRIGSTGNVGFASTTPWARLSVDTSSLSAGVPSFAVGSSTRNDFVVTQAGRVGIGTTSPEINLHIVSTVDPAGLIFDGIGSVAANFIGRRANGTPTSLTAAAANDNLLVLGARGYGTTGYSAASKASINFKAAETWTDSAQGTYLTFDTTATGGTTRSEKVRIDSSGNVGVGTTSPAWLLSLTSAVSTAQQAVAYDTTNVTQLLTSSVGDYFLYPSGNDALFNNSNLWVCTGGSGATNGCPSGTPSGQGNLIVETKVGVASSSPFAAISVGADGSIITTEKSLTDSGTIAIDWTQGNQQKVVLGGNRTISFSNYLAGSTLRLVLCQDGTGSRTITWPNGTVLLWAGGTAPTLTTTANKCDVTTFLATGATTTTKVFGSSVLAF